MICLFLNACISQTDDISWSGNLYALRTNQLEESVDDTVEILDLHGTTLITAETPDETSPEYKRFLLPEEILDQEIFLKVTGPALYPTLYAGKTPNNTSMWFNGALYGYGAMWTESFFLSLGASISSPAEKEHVQLIGRPSVPEDWKGAIISLFDELGEHDVQSYRYDETGFLIGIPFNEDAEKIDLFTSTDIMPGEIRLLVEHADGRSIETTYFAEGGTIINAANFVFSPNE